MNVIKFISTLLCITIISACSMKPDGSEYVGEWKDKSGGIAEFVKDGDAIFLVANGKKLPVTRNQDNTLKISGFMGDAVFSYSKSSDSVFATVPMGGNQELIRVK